jgi:lipopolysaccharide biosynthesis protein
LKLLSRLRSESERASYRAAMAYRRGGDALSFVCETHHEVPAQPPPGRRTLVLFAHFDPQGVVDPYVVHYLQALRGLGATIVFVSGSPTLTPESVAPIRSLCAGIYTRRTLALDFGSWHLAWCILREQGWSLHQFDRFVLANDSVYGPLFPIEEMWSSFHGADMYGAIESTELLNPHLQSFFLAWDLNSRTRPFLNDFWNGFQYVLHKRILVWRYEIGLSRRARKAGLSLKPFVSAATIKATYGLSPGHQWASRFSTSLNNTVYFWDGLIEHLRFPFLKTILPRYNTPWHDSMANLHEFLEEHTSYPYELIQANLDRLGCGEPAWVRPTRYAVLSDRFVDTILDRTAPARRASRRMTLGG